MGLMVLLALAGFALWVHLAQFSAILEWDSYVFVIIGRQVRHGFLPYRDLWEMKPPAVFYYLAAVFAVLPEALWSIRFADFTLYLLAAAAFYAVCRMEANRLIAALGTGAWLYFAHHQWFNLGGVYTEEYAAIGAVFAVAAAARYGRSGRPRAAFLTGIAVAGATLCKHPGAAAVLPAFILMTRRPSLRGFLAFVLGGAVPVVLVVAYFWYRGAFADFLDCNVWTLMSYGKLTASRPDWISTRLPELWHRSWEMLQPYPLLLGSIGVGLPVCLLRPTRLRFAAVAWVAIDFLGVAVQNHYYQHHYIQVFPSVCLLGTLALAWVLQPRPAERWSVVAVRLALAGALAVIAAPGLRQVVLQRQEIVRQQWALLLSGPQAWPRSPTRPFEEEVGAYIRDRTAPGDRLHVHGWNGTALGTYWAADRPVASQYFYDLGFPPDKQLADLERNAPAYVVVISRPPFLLLTPWLAADYSIETVKWRDYPAEIWVRTQTDSFAAGASTDLALAPALGGLTLPPQPLASADAAPRRSQRRRGQWTSPVLPVRSDDGKVFIDWNPRADLAWNRGGLGFPRAGSSAGGADVRALLGVPTPTGVWISRPPSAPHSVTLSLGFPAVVDTLVLVPGDARPAVSDRCRDATVLRARFAGDVPHDLDFQSVDGQWESRPNGDRVFHFSPQAAGALRLTATSTSCGFESGLRRIRIPAAGMGVAVRYRTGAAPPLDDIPWVSVNDGDEQLWVPARGYVQVQYELWSDYLDFGPVLRTAQVGRVRFEAREVQRSGNSVEDH